jgi:hypothetical protein
MVMLHKYESFDSVVCIEWNNLNVGDDTIKKNIKYVLYLRKTFNVLYFTKL